VLRLIASLLAVWLISAGTAAAQSDTQPLTRQQVTIFAAASLRDALAEAIESYPFYEGALIVVSYASSGTLARQIAAGAPAHIFVSANRKWADWLDEQGLVASGSRVTPFRNRLVLVQPDDETPAIAFDAALAASLGDRWLSIADPDHAPAGAYARETLQAIGAWEAVRSRVVRGQDVRGALALVERGEASAGIVFATDARASNNVRITAKIDPSTHTPIAYEILLVAETLTEEARTLHDYLGSPLAATIFARHGFLID